MRTTRDTYPDSIADLGAPLVLAVDSTGRPALLAWEPPIFPGTRWRHERSRPAGPEPRSRARFPSRSLWNAAPPGPGTTRRWDERGYETPTAPTLPRQLVQDELLPDLVEQLVVVEDETDPMLDYLGIGEPVAGEPAHHAVLEELLGALEVELRGEERLRRRTPQRLRSWWAPRASEWRASP